MRKRRIALFYGRDYLNEARILYMPFVLNLIKCLDEEEYSIDVYLAESVNGDYHGLFSQRVKIYFLDSRIIWRWGKGRKFYWISRILLLLYSCRLRNRYSLIIGAGVFGNYAAFEISRSLNLPYVYMGDEFPVLYGEYWNNFDRRHCRLARLVIVPDVSRIKITEELIGKLLPECYVLPNSPRLADVSIIEVKDWHKILGIDAKRKIILFAGGTAFFNQLYDLMLQLPRLSDEYVLVVIAPKEQQISFRHLLNNSNILWHTNLLSDADLYSLLQASFCSVGLYRTDVYLLDYVGMSSGKLMRAIACGTPVITSKSDSLAFIEKKMLGVQLSNVCFFPEAVNQIAEMLEEMRRSCLLAFQKELNYDVYWNELRVQIDHLYYQANS